MKSKTSFFNKMIFKKNCALYWPIWCGLLLVELLKGPARLLLRFQNPLMDKLEILLQNVNLFTDILLVAAAAVIIGMALFSYLFTAKSANMIHALPVTRTELFGTNVITGLLFLWIPELLSFFLSVLVCLTHGVADVQYLGMWILTNLGMSFFFFSQVVFCAMLTGQIFALPVYFLAINVLVEAVSVGMDWLVDTIAYGVSGSNIGGNVTEYLSPLLYFLDQVSITGIYDPVDSQQDYVLSALQMKGETAVLIYSLVGILFYLLAFYSYQKREIESAGDLLSFHWIKPVFRWGVGIGAGFFCGTFLMSFFKNLALEVPTWVWFILVIFLGMIAFFLAEMLIQKGFRVVTGRRLKECGLFLLFSALVFAGIYGYACRESNFIPQAESVEYAYVNMNYPVEFSGEEVQKVIELQRTILDRKAQLENAMEGMTLDYDYGYNYGYVSIVYRMKNGSVVERSYEIPSNSQVSEDFLATIYGWEMEKANFLSNYFQYHYEAIGRFTDAGVDWPDTDSDNYVYRYIGSDGATALYEAVQADLEDGVLQKYNLSDYSAKWEEQETSSKACLSISFYYEGEEAQTMYDRMNGTTMEEAYSRGGTSISFGPDCTHIVETLIRYELIQSVEEIGF